MDVENSGPVPERWDFRIFQQFTERIRSWTSPQGIRLFCISQNWQKWQVAIASFLGREASIFEFYDPRCFRIACRLQDLHNSLVSWKLPSQPWQHYLHHDAHTWSKWQFSRGPHETEQLPIERSMYLAIFVQQVQFVVILAEQETGHDGAIINPLGQMSKV